MASYSINVGTTIELIIFECGKEVTSTTDLFRDPNFFAQEYNVDYTKMVVRRSTYANNAPSMSLRTTRGI